MIENRPPRRFGSGPEGPDRPSRDDREQKERARQAAEARFGPKPPPVIEKPSIDPPARQPRILKHAPPAARARTDVVATPVAAAQLTPPHGARHPRLAEIRHHARPGRGRLSRPHNRDQAPPRRIMREGNPTALP